MICFRNYTIAETNLLISELLSDSYSMCDAEITPAMAVKFTVV